MKNQKVLHREFYNTGFNTGFAIASIIWLIILLGFMYYSYLEVNEALEIAKRIVEKSR